MHCLILRYQDALVSQDKGNVGSGNNPGGYSKRFYTGRLRPEVQPLTLLYTIFSVKAALSYTFYWKKATPFIYLLKTSYE